MVAEKVVNPMNATAQPGAGEPIIHRDPARLVQQPLVSVLMTSYNHAEYLADAIEGVMSQQADFSYELLIGEDASTDRTREIALEYQRRFPDRITVITSNGNVGTYANIRRIFAESRGTYIAFCEGDDFWCATDKLARQIAIFERDSRIGGVHSNWVRMHYRDDVWTVDWDRSVHRRTPASLLEGDLFSTFYYPASFRTCTMVYRRDALLEYYRSPLGINKYRFGDAAMAAFVSSRWLIGYHPEVTAVYRLSPGSSLRSGRRSRLQHMLSSLQFDDDARAYFASLRAYPSGFRWEICLGMLLWAMTIPDYEAMRKALFELTRRKSLANFLADGFKSVSMRLPTWQRQR